MTESELKMNLLRCCNNREARLMNNPVGIAVYKGVRVTYGCGGRGAPDLAGWRWDGISAWVEVKSDVGVLSKAQKVFADGIKDNPKVFYRVARPNNAFEVIREMVGDHAFEAAMSRWIEA